MHQPDFDVIVIGTGMGGGAAGYTFAKAGLRVLFLERGLSSSSFARELSGDYVERFIIDRGLPRSATLPRAGRSAVRINGAYPILGNGVGGSTAVYGALHLPFAASDFTKWPITFDEMRPYYDYCDSLFQPRGDVDPLSEIRRSLTEPAPLAAASRELFDFFRDAGMHPFRSPIAYDNQAGCQHCFGIFCPKGCKRTAGNVLVEPAVRLDGAKIEYQASAERLLLEQRTCTGVEVRTPSGRATYRAKYVFVAAGALLTPVLLLASQGEMFPTGLGNHADLVGRNLMRHLVDFYYVRTSAKQGVGDPLIEVTASDYHLRSDTGWGILNTVGGIMSSSLIAHTFLEQRLGDSRIARAITRLARKPLAKVIHGLLEGRMLVTSIMEDEARPANRILPTSTLTDIRLTYRISPRDQKRLGKFRRELLRLFQPLSPRLIKVAEDNMFLAHCCGTARMGDSAANSVTDSSGKIHGADNVFVVDASLFPSSGSSNPSMTVAACAMKISDTFLKETWKI